jgi:hypothetical protein
LLTSCDEFKKRHLELFLADIVEVEETVMERRVSMEKILAHSDEL